MDFYVYLQDSEKRLCALSFLPIHTSTWNSSVLTGQNLMNFDI
jgi:hypothetical protein